MYPYASYEFLKILFFYRNGWIAFMHVFVYFLTFNISPLRRYFDVW